MLVRRLVEEEENKAASGGEWKTNWSFVPLLIYRKCNCRCWRGIKLNLKQILMSKMFLACEFRRMMNYKISHNSCFELLNSSNIKVLSSTIKHHCWEKLMNFNYNSHLNGTIKINAKVLWWNLIWNPCWR